MLTTRGLLLLLLGAPVIAAATWLPALQWVALLYILACLGLFWIDRRLAEGIGRFEITRTHESRLSLGVANEVRLSVRNRGRFPVRFDVRDEAPEAFGIDRRVLSGEAGSRSAWEGDYHLTPRRRGDYEFGDIHLRWQGPLGLVVRQGKTEAAGPVKVYPNLLDIRRYDLLLKQNRLQEMGLRQARVFGEGTEYERLREYSPDDDYRRIDWKATARRARPITVEYQTERSQNVFVAIDAGRMMQSPVDQIAKLDYVVNAALLLAYVATGKGDKVGLMTFTDRVESFVSPKGGRGQFYRLLELLYRVEPQPVEPDYATAFAYLGLKHRKRSLVVIFTDISGGMGVQALVESVSQLSRQSLPLVVTIGDPDVAEAARVRPSDSLEAYQRAAAEDLLEARRLALETLERRGVPTVDVAADRLSLRVIERYLEIKGMMRL
ncbi:MAG TPA: DUF58 domain-containing protein [Anaerolineales bacterium]|nr:DUF58 domain-containing protein [Anaerolineales bacterium]